MVNPFPTDEALEALHIVIEALKAQKLKIIKSTGLQATAPISLERAFDNFTLGALVALDSSGARHTLVAVSGSSRTLCCKQPGCKQPGGNLPGIECSPPVASEKAIEAALEKNDKAIHILTDKINALSPEGESLLKKVALKKTRSALTTDSLHKVFSLYNFKTIAGQNVALLDIAKKTLPPGGTGDCAEVKILCDAFTRAWSVVSMCCISVAPKTFLTDFVKMEPCKARCGLVLPVILGLDFIFCDQSIAVINKSSGLLSIPGRTPDKSDCVTARFRRLFPFVPAICAPHRLDMETSGLMILSFNSKVQSILCKAFEEREVEKEYEALLCGVVKKKRGRLVTRQRVDIDNRPHQMIDDAYGKLAITDYEVIGYEKRRGEKNKEGAKVFTRVRFTPLTGRTHQLRVASAFLLNAPIAGDSLYSNIEVANKKSGEGDKNIRNVSASACDNSIDEKGGGAVSKSADKKKAVEKNYSTNTFDISKNDFGTTKSESEGAQDEGGSKKGGADVFGTRLMLHATKLCFTHPLTGEKLIFSSPAPF